MISFIGSFSSYASSSSTIEQTIISGALSTNVLNSNREAVDFPFASFSPKSYSYSCQKDSSASTGIFGSDSQRLYVMNPANASNGFTLTIAATAGASATWTDSTENHEYDFNDPTGSGCDDGVDSDSMGGQLTIDPSVGTLTTDCGACSISGVVKGDPASFIQGSNDSVTLLNASASSDDVWRGYLTGVQLLQTIPGEQLPGSYVISLTVTVTAS